MSDIGFFSKQRLIALRNRGMIDPERIDEYIARGGYSALVKALTEMTPRKIVEQIKRSKTVEQDSIRVKRLVAEKELDI